jgi:hypothetical protein
MISGGDWRFVSAREEDAMRALEQAGNPLQTYCVDNDVERGLRTGANDIFIVDRETIDEHDLEDELIRPIVGGKQVERWYAPWEDRYVIYTENDTDIDLFPNTKAYLSEHRDELDDRWCTAEGSTPWYAIDKTKSPELFENTKIITADILLYNNFWLDEDGEFYCLDTTYYLASDGGASEWYLLGLLNSDAVQFYFRRTAPTYKDEFLRYKSEYVEAIPVPDPGEIDSELITEVETVTADLQERVADYHCAEEINSAPEILYEKEALSSDSLSLAAYVTTIDLSDGDITDPYTDGSTVQLNVQDSVECRTEETATAFKQFVAVSGFETVSELDDASVPRTVEGLQAFVDAYEATAGSRDEIGQDIIELEDELNATVYDVYGVDAETRGYIEETVKTPTTPIHPKAMSD